MDSTEETKPQENSMIPDLNLDIIGPTETSSKLFWEWVAANPDKCILPNVEDKQ